MDIYQVGGKAVAFAKSGSQWRIDMVVRRESDFAVQNMTTAHITAQVLEREGLTSAIANFAVTTTTQDVTLILANTSSIRAGRYTLLIKCEYPNGITEKIPITLYVY